MGRGGGLSKVYDRPTINNHWGVYGKEDPAYLNYSHFLLIGKLTGLGEV